MAKISDVFLKREHDTLSEFAFLTENTRGRQHPQEPCENRTEFQRDRDKIIHCQSFRRLMYKTQVFLAPGGDHYRTRLTHTLEVSQVARIIARALRLNEDLTEAIALGHDLGHTPFGHSGEDAMRIVFDPDFAHYKQSLRVVDVLEKSGQGLNLTYEVRDGIVNHTGDHMASTLEGVIVKFADRIAYVNHDIDDAVTAGVLKEDDIPKELRDILGYTHSGRINRMVTSIISESTDKPYIKMEDEVLEATNAMRKFLFENVYYKPAVRDESEKGIHMVCELYKYFMEHPEKLTGIFAENIERDGLPRCVCDYISGMTDRYAIDLYRDLMLPKVWRGI